MIVLGAGGHARVVAEAWLASGGYLEGFRDDNEALDGQALFGYPILSPLIGEVQSGQAVIGIGSNEVRRRLSQHPYHWVPVVHPSSVVSPSAHLHPGTVVMAGAIVQTGADLGAHSIVNTRASVDHDCQIGDFAHIAPGATLCGRVVVGVGALIGAGAVVMPGIRIGPWATIGAGAVVAEDVPEGATVVGIPARVR